ncbi:MAG: hypothetical protein PVI57_12590 [Gemmatimonadota bacterium]|jgi:hypothetical protein
MEHRFGTAMACMTGLLLLATGCGDDGGPTGTVAGTLEVSLSTPHDDDAAIVFTITGPGFGQITASDPTDYLHVVGTGTSRTAVLVGDVGTGGLVRISVADVSESDAYTATVVQVADDTNALRPSLAGYALSISNAGN